MYTVKPTVHLIVQRKKNLVGGIKSLSSLHVYKGYIPSFSLSLALDEFILNILQIVVDHVEQTCWVLVTKTRVQWPIDAVLAQQPLKGSLFWFISQHLISTLHLMSKLSQPLLENWIKQWIKTLSQFQAMRMLSWPGLSDWWAPGVEEAAAPEVGVPLHPESHQMLGTGKGHRAAIWPLGGSLAPPPMSMTRSQRLRWRTASLSPLFINGCLPPPAPWSFCVPTSPLHSSPGRESAAQS